MGPAVTSAFGKWLGEVGARAPAAGLVLLALGVVATLWGGAPPEGLQWMALALLVMVASPARAEPGWRSLWPLLLLSVQGFGAIVVAVVVAATGALESGQAQRRWLAGGLLLFVAAALIDDHSLRLWGSLRQFLGLGLDAASAVIDGGEQVVRGAGWLVLLRWVLRPPARRATVVD